MRRLLPPLAAFALLSPVAAAAQDHSGHDMTMDHQMDGDMDMSGDRTAAENPVPAPTGPATTGPVTTGPGTTGPATAADRIWGAEAMQASRDALAAENGEMTVLWLQADRLEYQAREGKDGYLWDLQGSWGGDIDKLWVKSEGEGAFGEGIDDAEVQALYSHAIGPWFNLQTGVRQDLTGPARTHAVIGVQGIAPYMFELDAAAFLSNKGDLTARIEGEIDQRITQRLIVQPRAEVSLSAQDIPELGIGSGVDTVEAGVRLRYHFAREFAPYLGISQQWKLGGSADYARAGGEEASSTSYVVGMRLWY